jgi:uncharacterized membrane protein HdeD (DUF308 family)
MLTNQYLMQRYWWVLALRGLIAVIFGVAALTWPGLTVLVLVAIFGAYALVDGIIAVIVSLQERNSLRRWWVLLLEGIVGILIGIATFLWPGITAIVLLSLIAVWAIITGIFEIAEAFSGHGTPGQEWAIGIAGILSIVLGILLIAQPGAGLLTIALLIGIYAIIFGIMLIIRAFQFRSAHPAL